MNYKDIPFIRFKDFILEDLQSRLNMRWRERTGHSIARRINMNGTGKVFIIHGHDDQLKTEVQYLLTRARVPSVVLHEQPDLGRTIVDKLIEESQEAVYAVALLSPDDQLASGAAQARQNVILEIGYFLGKLGKDRVRLLKKGDVDIPSDLHGVLYQSHDASGAWRIRLLKEMQAVGIDVDIAEVVSGF